MSKKYLYHAVPMSKIHSIMKHGLVRNVSDPGIYFTDDAVSSLDWIKSRESIFRNNKHKKLGLVIFCVDDNDSKLSKYKDYGNTNDSHFPQDLKEAIEDSTCYVYSDDINPSNLTFEECVLTEDGDWDCYELNNRFEYVKPSLNLKLNILLEGFNMKSSFNHITKQLYNPNKDFYNQLKKDKNMLYSLYNFCLNSSEAKSVFESKTIK